MGYGPDNNKPLDWGKVIKLKVPKYAEVELKFSSSAAWENAICIYDVNYSKIVEKGTQHPSRNMNDYTIPRATEERIFFITGWHKNSPADGGNPWFQSSCRYSPNNSKGVIGFEDAGDSDYDDIIVEYSFK